MGIIRQWLDNREDLLRQKRRGQMDRVLAKLSRLPEGQSLLELARTKKIIFRITSDLPRDTAAVFDMSRFVEISSRCSEAEMAISAVHELRHVWQKANHLCLHRKTNIQNNLVMERFAEADAHAYEAHAAWKMTESGIEEKAWRVFRSNSPVIARAYENAVNDNRPPVKEAFNAFFEDNVLKDVYDGDALDQSAEQIDRIRQGQRATTVYDKIRTSDQPPAMSVEHLREFGALPDGTNYLADVNTRRPVYISLLSPGNQKKLARLEREYASLAQKTDLRKPPKP